MQCLHGRPVASISFEGCFRTKVNLHQGFEGSSRTKVNLRLDRTSPTRPSVQYSPIRMKLLLDRDTPLETFPSSVFYCIRLQNSVSSRMRPTAAYYPCSLSVIYGPLRWTFSMLILGSQRVEPLYREVASSSRHFVSASAKRLHIFISQSVAHFSSPIVHL